MMKKYTILLFLFIFPLTAFSQQRNDDDPFKRDPIFTKSLEELLGIDEVDRESEETPIIQARPVRRLSQSGLDLSGGFESGPYYANSLYSQYPNLSTIRYNRVEGLFLGIKDEKMQWKRNPSLFNIPRFRFHGSVGYGTASKEWDYSLGVERFFGEKKRMMIGFEIYDGTGTEDYLRTGLIENSLTSLFASYDFLDYHRMEGFGIYSVMRSTRWVQSAISYNLDQFNSLDRNTTFSFFGYSETYRENPPIDALSDQIDIERVSLSFAFNPHRVLIFERFTFSSKVEAEFTNNVNTDENYRYNKYRAGLELFYNFEPGSTINWRIGAGSIAGNAPDFKAFYLGGIGSLRAAPYKFYAGNQMLLSNLEVKFGRPGNRGEWIRDYNVHLLLFLDSGWTDFAPGFSTSDGPFSKFNRFSFSDLNHNVGAGIGTSAFRFEVAVPMNEADSNPVFWLRFNPTF